MEGELAGEIPYLRAFLHRLVLGQPHLEVDELQQQTMDRALRFRHRYDPAQPLRPWLQTIAFRLFLDARQAAAKAPGQLAMEPVARESASGADGRLGREEVETLLAHLSGQQADILRRFYLQQQSVADIAAALGLAEGTVKTHLHRARRRLAELLRAEAWT